MKSSFISNGKNAWINTRCIELLVEKGSGTDVFIRGYKGEYYTFLNNPLEELVEFLKGFGLKFLQLQSDTFINSECIEAIFESEPYAEVHIVGGEGRIHISSDRPIEELIKELEEE